MRHRNLSGVGFALVALGLGLVFSMILPVKFLVVILAFALAFSGAALLRS